MLARAAYGSVSTSVACVHSSDIWRRAGRPSVAHGPPRAALRCALRCLGAHVAAARLPGAGALHPPQCSAHWSTPLRGRPSARTRAPAALRAGAGRPARADSPWPGARRVGGRAPRTRRVISCGDRCGCTAPIFWRASAWKKPKGSWHARGGGASAPAPA